MTSKAEAPAKRKPGVSYRAEAPVYELFISVRSTHTGTTMSVSYHEWKFGDEPLQGHLWSLKHESEKTAKGFQHLSNLAGWAVRRCLSGAWQKVR